MFEFIKEIHRKHLIRDLKAAPREKKIDNIDEVRNIGVICRLGDEQHSFRVQLLRVLLFLLQ